MNAYLRRSTLVILCAALAITGCQDAPSTSSDSAETKQSRYASRLGSAPTGQTVSPPRDEPETVREVAQVGAGKKGHSYGGGLITEPASAYWRVQERIAFEVSIPRAMQLFKALDPSGQGPSSHEQFMAEIIRANQIKLPELPQHHRYVYDPQTEQLMIERPANPPSDQ